MQQTLDQLKSLKLIGLLEAWQEQQGHPTYHDLTFDERFALMVEREYLRRQHQRLQRRLKQAQLSTPATLEAVDFSVPSGTEEDSVPGMGSGAVAQPAPQPYRHGANRCGKTFLACVLADHLCKQGYTVRYFKTAELLADIKFAKVDGSFPKLRKHLGPLTSSFWMNGSAMLSPRMMHGISSTSSMTAIAAPPACWPPSSPSTSGIPKFKTRL
jgi:DNA replication protein DnaC